MPFGLEFEREIGVFCKESWCMSEDIIMIQLGAMEPDDKQMKSRDLGKESGMVVYNCSLERPKRCSTDMGANAAGLSFIGDLWHSSTRTRASTLLPLMITFCYISESRSQSSL